MEIIFFLGSALLFVFILFLSPFQMYIKQKLDTIFVQTFGTLLGLTVTVYGIFMALVPQLKRSQRKSEVIAFLGRGFLSLIVSETLVVVIGVFIFFTSNIDLLKAMVLFQLLFVIMSLSFLILWVYYMHLIFGIIRNADE